MAENEESMERIDITGLLGEIQSTDDEEESEMADVRMLPKELMQATELSALRVAVSRQSPRLAEMADIEPDER
ncbi:hypothetical protein FRC10_012004, partial [Ceratobasidium sp. 414]